MGKTVGKTVSKKQNCRQDIYKWRILQYLVPSGQHSLSENDAPTNSSGLERLTLIFPTDMAVLGHTVYPIFRPPHSRSGLMDSIRAMARRNRNR